MHIMDAVPFVFPHHRRPSSFVERVSTKHHCVSMGNVKSGQIFCGFRNYSSSATLNLQLSSLNHLQMDAYIVPLQRRPHRLRVVSLFTYKNEININSTPSWLWSLCVCVSHYIDSKVGCECARVVDVWQREMSEMVQI